LFDTNEYTWLESLLQPNISHMMNYIRPMAKIHLWITSFLIILLFFPVLAQAQVELISAERMPVDARYDSTANKEMQTVMDSYSAKMEKEISRHIGTCVQNMTSHAPESLLSNFLADQLLEKARELTAGSGDFSVLNFGGIRAPINKGDITVGDIYRVMPFENELVILKLKGSDVSSIFEHIAMEEGEAISNATLKIKDKQIESLIIGGAPLDEEKFYFVATMDYLADGNSGMEAFLNAVERIDTHLRVRDVYIEQIEKLTSQGKVVDASLDGRIKIINQ